MTRLCIESGVASQHLKYSHNQLYAFISRHDEWSLLFSVLLNYENEQHSKMFRGLGVVQVLNPVSGGQKWSKALEIHPVNLDIYVCLQVIIMPLTSSCFLR